MMIPEDFSHLDRQVARLERALAVFGPRDQVRIRAARAFAARAHEGQERQGPGNIPYIIHPIRVACTIADEFGIRDADLVVAALLHDVMEDCGVTADVVRTKFGALVAQYVAALTWPKVGRAGKWELARAMLRQPRAVRLVKASDIIDNSRATWAITDRAKLLQWMYSYGHWGRAIVASVGAPATIFLNAALAKTTTLHFGNDPEPSLPPNNGKTRTIEMSGVRCQVSGVARYPIRTHLVTAADDLLALVRQYALPHLKPGDLLAISERIVAIVQQRAFRLADIHPSRWATFLARFVHKSPYGIGLARPETMELAIREVGLPRLLFAAAIAALTKPLGLRGMFYRIVGRNINAIDGPCEYTLPIPFSPPSKKGGAGGGARADASGSAQGFGERYAKLGPKDPARVAEHLAREVGVDIAIIDANDLGVNVLGVSEGVDRSFVRAAFKDNPLGQTNEQTPMAIVRAAS
ncbi:HD domain-containing protein [Candidatus Uhrbacteria bacterium]|nr:HD domain-containing protein [Candidatus Uhrbacteria bacterium]